MMVEKMRMVVLLFVVKTTTMVAQASLPNRHMMVDEKMRMAVLVIFVKTTTMAVLVMAALFPVWSRS
jgi:hypothetical protein